MQHTPLTSWKHGKLLQVYVSWISGRCRSLLSHLLLLLHLIVCLVILMILHGLPLQVLIGGGRNHRMGLFDMVMIKDNHISTAGGVTSALKSVDLYLEQNNLHMGVEVVIILLKIDHVLWTL